ncbi:hypothetical protein J6590_065857 [Homalodisca vitripennis]|nr:hypothetical protein J6590_065857 [Homalodisca vitripennis]
MMSPSSRVASDLLSLNRSKSSRVIGLITWSPEEASSQSLHPSGYTLCRMCDEQDETAEHLLFECPSIARERYAIFGSLDKGGEFQVSAWDSTECAAIDKKTSF